MNSLPLAARLFVGGMIALGAALLVVCFPVETLRTPWLFLLLLALSSITSVFKVNLPLARERLDDVGVVCGGLRVAAAARPERDDDRRGGERLQPVHVPHQGAQPHVSHALQHGVPGGHRAGGGTGLHSCSAACPGIFDWPRSRKPLVGAATTYFVDQHAGHRHGDRAVDHAQSILQDLERELPVERAELLRRRRRGRAGRVDGHSTRCALAARRWRRRRSISPIAPTRSISAASTTSSVTCARWRICTWRRSKRWRWPSTPRIRPRSRTSGGCSSTRPRSRARSA